MCQAIVLRAVNDQICYELKNIGKSSLDLWFMDLNKLLCQNIMGYKIFLIFEFF
jgi:hypothetical protein